MKKIKEDFIRVSKIFDIYRANDKMISLGPNRSIETNISKIISFLCEKKFWPFFLVLSSVTILKEHFTRVHKLFLPLLYKL